MRKQKKCIFTVSLHKAVHLYRAYDSFSPRQGIKEDITEIRSHNLLVGTIFHQIFKVEIPEAVREAESHHNRTPKLIRLENKSIRAGQSQTSKLVWSFGEKKSYIINRSKELMQLLFIIFSFNNSVVFVHTLSQLLSVYKWIILQANVSSSLENGMGNRMQMPSLLLQQGTEKGVTKVSKTWSAPYQSRKQQLFTKYLQYQVLHKYSQHKHFDQLQDFVLEYTRELHIISLKKKIVTGFHVLWPTNMIVLWQFQGIDYRLSFV